MLLSLVGGKIKYETKFVKDTDCARQYPAKNNAQQGAQITVAATVCCQISVN